MTSAAIAQATVQDSPSYQDALLEVVNRAREGDEDALAYVFDNVFYDVYHEVFVATRDRRQAERVTREALRDLPALLRSRRYQSLAGLREGLVRRALPENQPAAVTDSGLDGLRASTRHFVLASTAVIAAVGALILAI
jgi:hypothetical protein